MKWIKVCPEMFLYKNIACVGKVIEVSAYKYPKHSYVSKHVDKIPGKRHYRLLFNKLPKTGGTPEVRECIFRFGPVMLFRADLEQFSVTPVIEGTGYSLAVSIFLRDGITVGLTNNFAY
jgi:hypothetical protein